MALHAAPVAPEGWQVPVALALSRAQKSGDAHSKIDVHDVPATFDGTWHVDEPADPVEKQEEPVAQLWPGCSAEQSPPTGMGVGFAAQVPAQHARERRHVVSASAQLALAHSAAEKHAPPSATDPTMTLLQTSSPAVVSTDASALRVHGPP